MSVVEIPLTRGKVALLDAWHAPFFQQWTWYARERRGAWGSIWYATTNWLRPTGSYRTVGMHQVIAFLRGWEITDHINGDGLDNRMENLRRATLHQNPQNRRLSPNNKYGCPGISTTKHGRFTVQIHAHGRKITLGTFDTLDEAIQARRDGEMQFHTHYPEEYRT